MQMASTDSPIDAAGTASNFLAPVLYLKNAVILGAEAEEEDGERGV